MFAYNHSRTAHIYIYTTDCNPTPRLLETAMHLRRVFSHWFRLRIRGENENARQSASRTTRRHRIVSTFPGLFPTTSPYRPWIFQWECFWSITNLPIPFLYSPAVFFFRRDRRDVNDSAAKRGTVW